MRPTDLRRGPARLEFVAAVEGGTISLPAEVLGRLAARGARSVRVLLVPDVEERERLASRGIDHETVARVATVQAYPEDVAQRQLLAEGSIVPGRLHERLRSLAREPERGAGG